MESNTEEVSSGTAHETQVSVAPIVEPAPPAVAPVPPVQPKEEEEREERAGIYLAASVAVALPVLIVLAILLTGGQTATNADGSPNNTGLDNIEVGDVETTDRVGAEVAGVAEREGETAGDAAVVDVIGEAEQLVSSDTETDVAAVSLESDQESSTGTANDIPNDNAASNASNNNTSNSSETVGNNTASSNDSASNNSATGPDVSETNTNIAPRVITRTTTTVVRPSTTDAPTTTQVSQSSTAAPTTSSTTSTSTSTTTTTSTTTSTTAPEQEPVEFAQRIDIGRIGETDLAFRFSAATTSSYVVTVREGSTVAATTSGTARADRLVNETVRGLTPGTDYTVQVTLTGPPAATSPRVAFRTSGGGDPEPAETQVTLGGVEVVDVRANRFQVNYTSNICANGSFTIREQGGAQVGSNSGQAAGCTTRHLAIPGFWTPALKPNTVYVITMRVEANGAGQGNGNVATRTLTVTTGS